MSKFKIMNAFQIKLLMVLLMLLDHLRYINNFIPSDIASFFTFISRCVAPMFAYFAVEGIRNTHNLKKYCLRLVIFAGITFAGNKILNSILESMLKHEQILLFRNNNVIFTLALGVIVIALIQWGKDKQTIERISLYALSMLCFIIGFLYGEWGTVILPFIFIEYFFRDKKVIRFLGYALIEVFA